MTFVLYFQKYYFLYLFDFVSCLSNMSVSYFQDLKNMLTYHRPPYEEVIVISNPYGKRIAQYHTLFSIVNIYSKRHKKISYITVVIIRQPLCPVVGRRPQHDVSKLPCLVLSSAISCRSSICIGRLSTAWLVSLIVFSCHMVSKW